MEEELLVSAKWRNGRSQTSARETGEERWDFFWKRRMISIFGVWNRLQSTSKEKPPLTCLKRPVVRCSVFRKVEQLWREEVRRNGNYFHSGRALCQLPSSTSGGLKQRTLVPTRATTHPAKVVLSWKGTSDKSRQWWSRWLNDEGSPVLALPSLYWGVKENKNLDLLLIPSLFQAYLSQELGDKGAGGRGLLHYWFLAYKPLSVYLGRTDGYRASCFDRINRASFIWKHDRFLQSEEGEYLMVWSLQAIGEPYSLPISSCQLDGWLFHQQIAKIEESLEEHVTFLEAKCSPIQRNPKIFAFIFDDLFRIEILQLEHELLRFIPRQMRVPSDGTNSRLTFLGELSRSRSSGIVITSFKAPKRGRITSVRNCVTWYLEGRYFIRSGASKGIHDIQKVISYARELKQLTSS